MSYKILSERERRWQPLKGLEGPFFYANGRVLYYDVKEGEYWDPTTDFYVDREELALLQNQILDTLRK